MQPETKGSLIKCLLCERPTKSRNSFTCKQCRKSPFCYDHLDPEYKMCSGCATEARIRLYSDLLRQERGVRAFLRLTQFIFILAAIFFAADKLLSEHVPELLKGSFLFGYVFFWGGAAIAGMALCYALVFSQRQKKKEVEDKIHSHKVHSRYMFR